jgi:pimeloyl-ACP methyl ester carboxylesterase
MNIQKIIVLLLSFILLLSCSKTAELSTNQSDVMYVRNKGADMPAYIYGNAASKVFIVLIHGGPGGNGLEYRGGQYAEELETDYAMVYWDQRGQGMSQGNYPTEDITINTMAEDLFVLVKSLKYRYGTDIKVFLLGHSWGGMLGTAYMINPTYQAEVAGWIESNGAHDIPLLNTNAIRMFKEIGQQQIAQGVAVADWQEMVDFANTVDTSNISNEEGGKINEFGFKAESIHSEVFQGTITNDQSAFQQVFFNPTNPLTSYLIGNNTAYLLENEVESTSLTNQLYKITQPTLLLWGKYDFVVSPALGYSAYDLISSTDKELVIFEHSGHSPMDNEPTPFVAAIKQFVERNR